MAILTLLLGILSWIVPIYGLIRRRFSIRQVSYSYGLAILSLLSLFLMFSDWVVVEDWAAIMDVYPTARNCAILLVIGVILLNLLSWSRQKKNGLQV